MITRRRFLRSSTTSAATVAAGGMAVMAAPSTDMTPDERIEAAIGEIRAAMAEKWPTWRVQVRNDIQRPLLYVAGGQFKQLDPSGQTVLVFVSEEKHGPVEARWLTVDKPGHAGGEA